MADSPSSASSAIAVSANLRELVGHQHCVAGVTTVARVQKLFQQHRFNFMAVVEEKRVIGLCSRERIGGMLGSQFGFSIYGKKPIRDFMVPQPEIIRDGTPIQSVLDRVFSRSSERFYEDAVLVDDDWALLGLIPVDNLVRLQNQLLSEKIRQLEHSEDQLIRQKHQLQSLTLDLENANQELESARDLALEGARLKSEFLANMSHEIRTPMNGVVGMISLLQESDLSDEQRHYADTVQRSADALLGIINDILDYSKIEAGKLDVQAEDTPIRELVEECGQLMAKVASTKGLELVLDIAPEVPDWVRLDPLRYRQILNNLIGNALKFTHEGEVCVVLDHYRDPERGVFLRTLVRDSGIGISEKEQKHLFNAFMQADGSTSRKYGGTGLGLAISKRLANLMEGDILFSSVPGEGSAFWADLPLLPSEGEDFASERSRVHPGLRVLVVDDHPRVREVMERFLIAEGCHVDSLDDMAEALRRVRESLRIGKPYDFVFVETDHAGMGGCDFCEKIRADRAFNDLQVFTLSDVGNRARPCCDGVHRLYKPVCPTQLRRGLEKYQPDQPAHARAASDAGESGEGIDTPTVAMRVLLVEDSPTNQEVAIQMLEKFGHTVFLAENGLQALELLRAESVDCVLMDCQMPEMDGYACTRAIREGYHGISCRDVPIIATTAHAMKGDRQKCLDAGMNDYLSKPMKMRDLGAALGRVAHLVRA